MTRKIFRYILFVSSVVLAVGIALTMVVQYHYFGDQLEEELEREASYLEVVVKNQGVEGLKEVADNSERITLIDAEGAVLYDNRADESSMENHADREEFVEAKSLGRGKAVRQSETMAERTIYFAIRLESGEILRVSSTQYNILALIGGMVQPVVIVLVIMIILAAVFADKVAARIVEPINKLDLEHPEDNDNSYEEITPLLTKIHKQQRQIGQQLAEAVHRQEEFQVITDNMQEGLLVIGRQTELLSCNRSALKLLGVKEAEEKDSVLALNRSEPFRKSVEAVLSGKHESIMMQIQDRVCSVIVNPVFQDGKVTGGVLLLLDVTEKMERERLRREFTANVSHELKTPLTSIQGYAEIMKEGIVASADVPKFSEKIFEEAGRMITLVEDILKISRLDEGCLPYEDEDTDVYECVENAFAHLQSSAQRKNVELSLTGEHCHIMTKKTIFEEMIYNLCDNGIKYNREGGKLSVSIDETAEKIEVKVEDTGIGIPAGDLEKIFERFYRVDKSHSREIGGTGLGLSIVKHAAACLNMNVDVTSQEGTGSVFKILIKK